MNIVELYKDDILDLITLGSKYSSFDEDNGDYIKMQIRDVDSDDILYTFYSNRLLLEYEVGGYYFGDYHYSPELGFMEGIEHTKEPHDILLPTRHWKNAYETQYTMKKQFNIYKDSNETIYIKPNEILGKVDLEENNYKLVLYFFRDIRSMMGDNIYYDDWVERETSDPEQETMHFVTAEEGPPQSKLPNILPNGHWLDWPASIRPPFGWKRSTAKLPHVERIDGPGDTPGIRMRNNSAKNSIGGILYLNYIWLEAGATYILSGSCRASGPIGGVNPTSVGFTNSGNRYQPRIKIWDDRRNVAYGVREEHGLAAGWGHLDQTHTRMEEDGIISWTQHPNINHDGGFTNPRDTRVIDAVWNMGITSQTLGSTEWTNFSTEFTPITNYLKRMGWDANSGVNLFWDGDTTSSISIETGEEFGGCAIKFGLYSPQPMFVNSTGWHSDNSDDESWVDYANITLVKKE